MQLKSTKRAIDCMQFIAIFSFSACYKIYHPNKQSLSALPKAREPLSRENVCRTGSVIGHAFLCNYSLLYDIYSHIVLINLNLGHSFILRKGGKANRTKKPIGYV